MSKQIVDAIGMKRALMRMTYEIIERNKGTENLVLVGIKTRGLFLAQRIAANLKRLEKVDIPVGALDISSYRDDLPESEKKNLIHNQQLDFDITNKNVVLVDDVLFTGRTIRAALDALMDQGRPAKINLAVLVDRGHRELPIRPDFIGKNIPTAMDEEVKVSMTEVDGQDNIELIQK
jgi:pyrimidine operon attenuation protein/uracil phosphoribosyltransferase